MMSNGRQTSKGAHSGPQPPQREPSQRSSGGQTTKGGQSTSHSPVTSASIGLKRRSSRSSTQGRGEINAIGVNVGKTGVNVGLRTIGRGIGGPIYANGARNTGGRGKGNPATRSGGVNADVRGNANPASITYVLETIRARMQAKELAGESK
ncbi:hypothetical protein LOK49_LG07G02003 [Camellia lanceoleosa]|uniref:Uncharacterized protein n=1 Tax=Camellia lanceoleosa TaxID=1840588 RepID=A0ACC0H7Z8_9ERIC|nr:hypothetical protein LOK49_LG07G02003 [Camellia lanceoleosa]